MGSLTVQELSDVMGNEKGGNLDAPDTATGAMSEKVDQEAYATTEDVRIAIKYSGLQQKWSSDIGNGSTCVG